MQLGSCTAAVDNDFISNIVQTRRAQDEIIENVRLAFDEMNLKGIVHPLVYQHEVINNCKNPAFVNRLFDEQILRKVEFEDIFQGDPDKKAYYLYLVFDFFRSLKGESLPVANEELLTYWRAKNSLGEVHSIAMCLIANCGIFLSDDKDSKRIAWYIKHKDMGNICVYSREEFFAKHNAEGKTTIPRPERRALSHV